MPFLPPNEEYQSNEGITYKYAYGDTKAGMINRNGKCFIVSVRKQLALTIFA